MMPRAETHLLTRPDGGSGTGSMMVMMVVVQMMVVVLQAELQARWGSSVKAGAVSTVHSPVEYMDAVRIPIMYPLWRTWMRSPCPPPEQP